MAIASKLAPTGIALNLWERACSRWGRNRKSRTSARLLPQI